MYYETFRYLDISKKKKIFLIIELESRSVWYMLIP